MHDRLNMCPYNRGAGDWTNDGRTVQDIGSDGQLRPHGGADTYGARKDWTMLAGHGGELIFGIITFLTSIVFVWAVMRLSRRATRAPRPLSAGKGVGGSRSKYRARAPPWDATTATPAG